MRPHPFYETIYHVEGYTLADAFRPQPGWGTRTFHVPVEALGEHTEQEVVAEARKHAPERHRLTCVRLYPAEGEPRVIWSTPACPEVRAMAKAAPGVPVLVATNPSIDQGPCTVCGKLWRDHGTYPVYESHNYTPAGGVDVPRGGEHG